ncbi:hypothetical protein [Cognatishimia sp. MH4019]|uniref:hypothetical protein n=1 Tax=Cognatishimia sp. MH4019 TaxID=2854030 RepID=UPI001CD7851D|nr:hypothetical protein [Cognatishimia sp. MH4019]
MKRFVLIGFCALSLLAAPVSAAVILSLEVGLAQAEHGGGCRKHSPQGQCCHAGSKPYHCH